MIEKELENFKNYLLVLKGYSIKTYLTYEKYCIQLIKNDLDYLKTIKLYPNVSNNTRRVILSSFKKFYEFKRDERKNELSLPKRHITIQKWITFNEYKKMLAYLENKNLKTYIEKYIVIRLLFETGIRASELLAIQKKDILKNKIIIRGKNNKQRIVFLNSDLYEKLIKFIGNRDEKIFNTKYKNLYKKVNMLGQKVLGKKISPHMFRRGFATHCSNNKIDIFDICILMGHENINTTITYIKRGVSNKFLKIFS